MIDIKQVKDLTEYLQHHKCTTKSSCDYYHWPPTSQGGVWGRNGLHRKKEEKKEPPSSLPFFLPSHRCLTVPDKAYSSLLDRKGGLFTQENRDIPIIESTWTPNIKELRKKMPFFKGQWAQFSVPEKKKTKQIRQQSGRNERIALRGP